MPDTLSDKSPARGEDPGNSDRGPLDAMLHSVWILYNFTRTDIKTIVVPQAFFGLATALSGYPVAAGTRHVPGSSSDSSSSSSSTPLAPSILANAPLVISWLWLNLLIFTLANQRLPSSILEDAHNKPWRNIPANAVQPGTARRILVVALCLSWLLSACWGVWFEFAALAVLIWIYNDLGGAEEHYLVRNFLNAGGYVFFGLGALKLALKGSTTSSSFLSLSSASPSQQPATPPVLGPAAVPWALLAGLAVATTIQVQDLQDQTGDRVRNRRTLPLVLGDRFCRWTVALAVLFWSLVCPAFWHTGAAGYLMTATSGSVVAALVLYHGYSGLEEGEERARRDEKTFLAWCLWLALLYLLPLVSSWEAQGGRTGSFVLGFQGDVI